MIRMTESTHSLLLQFGCCQGGGGVNNFLSYNYIYFAEQY